MGAHSHVDAVFAACALQRNIGNAPATYGNSPNARAHFALSRRRYILQADMPLPLSPQVLDLDPELVRVLVLVIVLVQLIVLVLVPVLVLVQARVFHLHPRVSYFS